MVSIIEGFHCTGYAHRLTVHLSCILTLIPTHSHITHTLTPTHITHTLTSHTHTSDSEDLLARTVIVGIIMAFRKLTLEALNNVLTYRVPFMLSSIMDFKHNLPDKTSSVRERG